LSTHIGDVDKNVVVITSPGIPRVLGDLCCAGAKEKELGKPVGRVAVSGIRTAGQADGEEYDLSGDRMRVDKPFAFFGETGQDDVWTDFAQ